MTPLRDELVARIREHGPLPFAAYMAHALYHPRFGYYSSGAPRTDRSGDYLTSPELDPSFGALWAAAFEQIWDSSGRPHPFDIVEVGPGEGGFARALLAATSGEFADALRLTLVERTPALEDRQREGLDDTAPIGWVRSIAELPRIVAGIVFANEVLDNLPVHLVERSGDTLFEVCVGERNGKLAFELLPPSSNEIERYLDRLDVRLPEGHRYEVGLAAESFVRHAARSLRRGALVLVDYGATAGELVLRPGGSLLAYSRAGVDDGVLQHPGERDITAHVNWTAVEHACRTEQLVLGGPWRQRDVLIALGAHELVDDLRRERDNALGAKKGSTAVRAMSRGQAVAALLDPAGLGGMHVTIALRGIREPALFAAIEAAEGGAPHA